MNAQAQPQISAAQYNQAARLAILGNSLDMLQQIFGQAIDPTAQSVVNIQPQNVGLIKGFYVEIVGTLHNGDGAVAATLTPLGASNLLKQITYNDLQNNVRINTSGWHMAFLDAARNGYGYGAAISQGLPLGFGANYPVQSAPASIAVGADGAVRFVYYIPLAYAADDFRGAVYANVVQATQNLQLTLNVTPGSAAADTTLAVYSGTASLIWKANTKVTVNVYQSYLDQIPVDKNGNPILPIVDLSTIYEIKNTTVQGVVANADYGIPFANFRDFLSTFAIYDQAGTLNAGSDVNYWAIQAANFTNFVKVSPYIQALRARLTFMSDLPAGMYYWDFRKKPINTNQYGNTQIVLNASSAAAGSTVLVGYEAFAYTQALVGAGSLPS